MKFKILLSLLVLFFIYSLFCLIRPPAIADALIILSIGSLAGFFFFIISNEKIEKIQEKSSEQIELEKLKIQKDLLLAHYDLNKVKNMQTSLKAAENEAKKSFLF